MIGHGKELGLSFMAASLGIAIPVLDPTGAALGFLEMQVRNRISSSKITYPAPSEKERKV